MATKCSGFSSLALSGVRITDRVLSRGSYATALELEYMGLKCAGKKIHEVLLVDGNSTFPVSRFERECCLLSQLQHPNVVEFLGVFFQDESQAPILVSEYLPADLTSCIKYSGTFPEKVRYSVLHDVALGLNYLHTHCPPIVHRDLTSNNVLLTSDMTAKISDLGVATIVDMSPLQVCRVTRTPGTPAYMPPELMIGDPPYYDTGVDVFSYGIMMIHTLSGQWPEPQAESSRVEGCKLVPASEANRRWRFIKTIGEAHPLVELILRCIHNDPQQRPNTGEIVDKLSKLVGQFPAQQPENCKFTGTLFRHKTGQRKCIESVVVVVDQSESETTCSTPRRSKLRKAVRAISAENLSSNKNANQVQGKMMPVEKQLKGLFSRKQKTLKRSAEDQSVSVMIPDERTLPVCVARYGYDRVEVKELSFKRGELLYIITDKDKWWFVRSKETEQEGYVPSNYVIRLPRGEEIDQNDIRLVDKVGEGQFSYVWRGVMYGALPVTVKVSRPMCACQSHEAAVLLMLSHPNIVQLYGVCSSKVPLCTVLEFMKHGSLFEYLRNDGKNLQASQLMNVASQVAAGMAHLEQHNYVHRGLATRNVLVGDKLVCKLANFEFAQVVREGSSMVAMDPCVKWMAPESILYSTFTVKSDVWSFGIVLYEIFTHGRIPYPGFTNVQVLDMIQRGYRMPRPVNCPERVHDIMLGCWKDDPDCRLTFETLKWQLEDFFVS